MQTEEEQSDISTTSIIRADSKSGKLYVSQKLQSKTLDGIHKLLRFKKKHNSDILHKNSSYHEHSLNFKLTTTPFKKGRGSEGSGE